MSRAATQISHSASADRPSDEEYAQGNGSSLIARFGDEVNEYGGRVSFAQQGPPASAKQIAYIQALLRKAGYDDFRSARTEYRLTQRQARGKFTKTEASAMIDRLTSTDDENPTVSISEEPDTLDSAQALLIRGFPADVLADELRRRGWTVVDPER
jgi:hypothetical protein